MSRRHHHENEQCIFSTNSILGIYNSCAIAAIEALRKKGVNVKYARDESMSHNTLNPVQSLDQNANVMKKTTMIQEEFVFYVFIFPL